MGSIAAIRLERGMLLKPICLAGKLMCGVFLVGILLTAGITAFADSTACAGSFEKALYIDNTPYHGMQAAIDKLVSEGRLAKDKADKIKQYIQNRIEERKKLTQEQRKAQRGYLLKDLKDSGVITQEEARMIREKTREMREEKLKSDLNALVEKGVISTNDLNRINNYLTAVKEERRKAFEQAKDMTPDQRKVFFEKYKKERKDIIQRMLDDGVITKPQAAELRKVFPGVGRYCPKAETNVQ